MCSPRPSGDAITDLYEILYAHSERQTDDFGPLASPRSRRHDILVIQPVWVHQESHACMHARFTLFRLRSPSLLKGSRSRSRIHQASLGASPVNRHRGCVDGHVCDESYCMYISCFRKLTRSHRSQLAHCLLVYSTPSHSRFSDTRSPAEHTLKRRCLHHPPVDRSTVAVADKRSDAACGQLVVWLWWTLVDSVHGAP